MVKFLAHLQVLLFLDLQWPRHAGNGLFLHSCSEAKRLTLFGRSGEFEIGFDWVCFSAVREGVYFYNPFVRRRLGLFWLSENWVCFA